MTCVRSVRGVERVKLLVLKMLIIMAVNEDCSARYSHLMIDRAYIGLHVARNLVTIFLDKGSNLFGN